MVEVTIEPTEMFCQTVNKHFEARNQRWSCVQCWRSQTKDSPSPGGTSCAMREIHPKKHLVKQNEEENPREKQITQNHILQMLDDAIHLTYMMLTCDVRRNNQENKEHTNKNTCTAVICWHANKPHMLYTSFPQTKNMLHVGNFGRTSCKSIRESLHFQEKLGPEQCFSVLLFKHVQTHVHTLRFRVPIRSNKTPLGDTPSSSNKKTWDKSAGKSSVGFQEKPEVLWFFETNTCLGRRSQWKLSKAKWWLWWRSRTPFNNIFDQMMLKCLDNKLIVVRECVLSSSQGSGPILNPLPQKATLVTIVGYACFFQNTTKIYTNLNQKSH